jgi:hypothetical protein
MRTKASSAVSLDYMTFSDTMFASIREFYFRGTPYPPGAGIDDSPQAKAVVADVVADQQGEAMAVCRGFRSRR